MLKIDTMMENTVSRSPNRGPFTVCAALWHKPAAMMSNKVLRTTTARRVVRHTMQIVDSQPTTTGVVMVTRDPHEEGFDIGPRGGAAVHQQARDRQAVAY